MTKSRITALKKKGWKIDKESEEALSQLKNDEALAHVASAMQNLTKDNQEFIRSVVEGLNKNTDAIVTLVSKKNESPTVEPATPPPAPQEQVVAHPILDPEGYQEIDEGEKKQWEFLVERNRDGFISRVEAMGGEKQWEFVIHRNSEGFISKVDVQEV